jgi:hypothetical protein
MPHIVCSHPDFIGLSAHAKALLFALFPQLRFYKNGNSHNNGDLCATATVLRKYGWHSKSTLEKALRELEEAQVLVRTRQGGRHRCSLFALSWLPIGDCRTAKGFRKLDTSPTSAPPVNWYRKGCPASRVSTAPPDGAVEQTVTSKEAS